MNIKEFEGLKKAIPGFNKECPKCHECIVYEIPSGKPYVECSHCGYTAPLTQDEHDQIARMKYLFNER